MKWAICACLVGQMASAQESYPRPETDFVGSVTVFNDWTHNITDVTTHTINGVDVTIHYHSTPNMMQGVDPRDIVRVVVPEGYIAIPAEYLLPERESVTIRIYELLLG